MWNYTIVYIERIYLGIGKSQILICTALPQTPSLGLLWSAHLPPHPMLTEHYLENTDSLQSFKFRMEKLKPRLVKWHE